VLAEDGDINDADRIMFLRGYLIELIPNCPELSKRWQDRYCQAPAINERTILLEVTRLQSFCIGK